MRGTLLTFGMLVVSPLFAQGKPPSQPSSSAPVGGGRDIILDTAEIALPGGGRVRFELGTLYVAENRANPASRRIGVGFARFRATPPAGTAATDASPPNASLPIFVLPGGPGQSYLTFLDPRNRNLQNFMREIALYRTVGDVILVDQRGASPRGDVLRFTTRQPASPLDQPASLARATATEIEIAKAAVADAAAKGIDLAGYTVLECADDVNDLRNALGYDKIALVGTSFGSQWSFAVMRRHSQIVARALLSGVEPLDHGYDMPSGVLAAIGRMALAAEQDPRIKPYVPPEGIMGAARRVVGRLEREPITIGKTDPQTGEVATVIGAEDFRRSFPKGRDVAATILSLYHGQYNDWAMRVAAQRRGGMRQLALLGPLIDGSLGVTPARAQRLRTDTAIALLGQWNFDAYMATAEIWPSPDVGDSIRVPVKTEIPVVFAQGDWDTSTPVENTFEIAPFFPNGHVIVAHHGGHGVIDDIAQRHPKVMEQLVEFLRTGRTAGLPKEVDLPVGQFVVPSFPPPTNAGTCETCGTPSAAKGTKPNGM